MHTKTTLGTAIRLRASVQVEFKLQPAERSLTNTAFAASPHVSRDLGKPLTFNPSPA